MTTTDELRAKIKKIIHGDTPDQFMSANMLAKPDAIMSLVEIYSKEMLEDVIGDDEQTVMGRGVPGYTKNLLRGEQHKRAAKYFASNIKKGKK
jgi:hypothetical protein